MDTNTLQPHYATHYATGEEISGSGAGLGAGIIVGGILAIGIVGYAAPRIGHGIMSAARGIGRAIDRADSAMAKNYEAGPMEMDLNSGLPHATLIRRASLDDRIEPEEPIIGK